MRILVVSRPQFPIPPEEVPGMVEAFAAWREKYRSVTETFEFFAGGGGGYGVVDVDDAAALHQMMLEYPFGASSELEIRPILGGDQGLAMWQEGIRAMMAAKGDG